MSGLEPRRGGAYPRHAERRKHRMYPASFEYFAPETIHEVVSILGRFDDEGKVLAGGQSLIPLMKLRFAAPRALIDINRIPGLDGLEEEGGSLRIGALVRHKTCERSALLRGRYGALGSVARLVADPLVRNLGTVCGSLAHADPQGDWASVMLACGAEVVARKRSGERVIPMTELITSVFTTQLEPDELITEVRIPKYAGPSGGTYLKLERKVGDYATVGVATHLTLDAKGTIAAAGIAMTAVASPTVKPVEAEQVLFGAERGAPVFPEAGRTPAAAAEPQSD